MKDESKARFIAEYRQELERVAAAKVATAQREVDEAKGLFVHHFGFEPDVIEYITASFVRNGVYVHIDNDWWLRAGRQWEWAWRCPTCQRFIPAEDLGVFLAVPAFAQHRTFELAAVFDIPERSAQLPPIGDDTRCPHCHPSQENEAD